MFTFLPSKGWETPERRTARLQALPDSLPVHRAVSSQLDQLWRVLWEAHQGQEPTPGPEFHTAAAAPIATTTSTTRASNHTLDVAVAAAQRLVLAFSELRQFESLLTSLMGSWREWETASAATSAAAGGTSWLACRSSPVAVLSSPALLQSLCSAVALLPSGESEIC